MTVALCALVGLGGCCREAAPCPQNDVAVFVRASGPVPGVTIEGHPFDCVEQEEDTICVTGQIADGEHDLVVRAPDHEDRALRLVVRTLPAPPFSCECEIPSGTATVELDALAPPEEGDAGTGP